MADILDLLLGYRYRPSSGESLPQQPELYRFQDGQVAPYQMPTGDPYDPLREQFGVTDMQRGFQAAQEGNYPAAAGNIALGTGTMAAALPAGAFGMMARGVRKGVDALSALDAAITKTRSVRPEMVYRDIDLSKLPANPEDFRGFLRGAAWYEPQRNVITGTHVTDNPNVVIDTLRRGDLLTARGDKYGDLGRGLYFSDTPEMWMSRSRDKWEFLDRLTSKERQGLATSLQAEIDRMPQGYISQSERESALRGLDRFASGQGSPHAAINFAEQPYNIDFSRPDFLTRLGIAPSPQPQKVPIEVRGRFADLKRNISEAEAQQLRDLGYVGAFTRNSMGTTAQSVVYDPLAVRRFGDWFR